MSDHDCHEDFLAENYGEMADYNICPAPTTMGGMDSEWENYGDEEMDHDNG